MRRGVGTRQHQPVERVVPAPEVDGKATPGLGVADLGQLAVGTACAKRLGNDPHRVVPCAADDQRRHAGEFARDDHGRGI